MRRLTLTLAVTMLLAAVVFAAGKLSRNEARKRITELAYSKIVPEAVDVRQIVPQGDNEAIAETVIALAVQFKKDRNSEWAVDSVRLGDRDWLDMSELIAATYGGSSPYSIAQPALPPAPEVRPSQEPRLNVSDFDKTRKRKLELTMSRLVPDAIRIQRIVSQNDIRTVADATVRFDFRFVRDTGTGRWTIEAARLGERDWVSTPKVLTTLEEGRRRETRSLLQKLLTGIEAYRARMGSLPQAMDIVTLTDILHPNDMPDLVRLDAWKQPIDYWTTGSTFRLSSRGPDGKSGTPDDIVYP